MDRDLKRKKCLTLFDVDEAWHGQAELHLVGIGAVFDADVAG